MSILECSNGHLTYLLYITKYYHMLHLDDKQRVYMLINISINTIILNFNQKQNTFTSNLLHKNISLLTRSYFLSRQKQLEQESNVVN